MCMCIVSFLLTSDAGYFLFFSEMFSLRTSSDCREHVLSEKLCLQRRIGFLSHKCFITVFVY